MTRRSPAVIWIENVPQGEHPQWSTVPDGLRTPHPYRRVRRRDTAPPSAVWLEPACAEERTWCVEDAWGACCECGLRPVTYAPIWDWQRRQEAWR